MPRRCPSTSSFTSASIEGCWGPAAGDFVRVGAELSEESRGLLSVMMPAYNEERTIELILEHVLDRPEVGEVIAIDDGSTDGTWEILSGVAEHDPRLRIFRQAGN